MLVEYIEYRDGKMYELRCMRGCGTVIGRRKEGSDKFVHWNNYRTWPVSLKDGSYQNILVCTECVSICSEADFETFDESRRWGWEQDMIQRNHMSAERAKSEVAKYSEIKAIVGRMA